LLLLLLLLLLACPKVGVAQERSIKRLQRPGPSLLQCKARQGTEKF
jgi:hypothetical protein